MKKATPHTKRSTTPSRLDAVVGGGRAQIIDLGNPNPESETESDARAQIIDLG